MEPNSLTAELETQLEVRTRELAETRKALAEALEQQTATSEILRVISSSPTELQRVLDAGGENAARLCDANNAVIFRLEGDLLRQVALYGGLPTTSHPAEGLPVNRGRVTGRAVFERRTIHVHDLAAEEDDFPEGSRDARRDGHRTTLATPLLREGVPIGAILIRRMEVRPFSEKQIALLGTFADQAAIAIENTRLLNELRESLQQQTATSEVLQVISSSPGELEPVFENMLANATSICGAKFGVLFRPEADAFRAVALHGAPPSFAEERQRNPLFRPSPRMALARAAAMKQAVQIADVHAEPNYFDASAGFSKPSIARLAGARTVLAVPMLREQELEGVIVITARRFAPSPTSRSRWSRTSRPKPSSPSRTPACSTSCASPCSSRPRPRRCCKSSPARRASSGRCSRQCCRTPCGFAKPVSATCSDMRMERFAKLQASTPRQPLWNFSDEVRFNQPLAPVSRAWSKQSRPRISAILESSKPMQIVIHL